jgi:eukaryotic-like serine/threonine-protein kinase
MQLTTRREMPTSDLAFRDLASGLVLSRPEPLPPLFASGSVLAERFTIRRFIARGAWGDVYEASDRKRSQRVALKTLPYAVPADASAKRRFVQELELARGIAHRRVCRIGELHEHRQLAPSVGTLRLLTLEFIDGESLAARIARGRIPLRTVGRIARQLLEGLRAAHAAGVLHLDFKSQNVMLRTGLFRSEAVITDFNLTRAIEAGAPRHARERHVFGSPGYLSPEQLEDRPVLGITSDLYSFGVVLFEMLTGRLPFPKERAKALMALQLARPTPVPSQVLPGLTTALDPFVAKCLARHPKYRYPDAESALAALDDCLARPATGAKPSRRPGRRR